LISILLLFAAKAYYDTNSIEVKHYRIENSSVGEVLSGLKLAHLSDLHIKNMGLMESKILETLKEEKPDLIFITGDLISFRGRYEPSLSFLQQLKPPLGAYAVFGNIEYSNENGSCTLCHQKRSKELKEKQSLIFLRNSFIPLEINGKVINIVGVDDPVNKKSDLKTALKTMNSGDPSILLAHSPETFEEASGFGIDFLLAGHNHGGQIFVTRFLRKILPLDPALEFLEGFFQKGKTLMYVSRGIGTSFLPFRLGVKPEITFFKFTNDTNEKIRIAPVNPSNLSREMRSLFHWDPINPTNSIKSLLISNTPPITIFTGFNFANLVETFNVLNIFDSLGLTAAPQHPDTATRQRGSTARQHHSNPAAQKILFDFESESELEKLNWECHKWFELSGEHVTSGKHCLRVILPPGQYPGINFENIKNDWSQCNYLRMDIFNPSDEDLKFHIRIDDHKSGWEYGNRFNMNWELKKGMNHISIPTDSIRTNIHHRPLNLEKIKRMMVFIPDNPQKREIYIDNIRLE
jgi:predicted MPP superfamily phosphohydrolase